MRVSTLDCEVERARRGAPSAGADDTASTFVDPEPWPNPVHGAALADEIRAALHTHIVFAEECHVDAVTLWCWEPNRWRCGRSGPRR